MIENKDIKVVFFGSSNFAVSILKKVQETFDLRAVVTQPDQPAGRGKTLTPTPVSMLIGESSDVKIFKYNNLKELNVVDELKNIEADIFLVAAYGQIIPKQILDLPKHGSLNFHGSILPKYRGSSPIQEALKNGDTITGVTLIKMDEKMDHGDIVSIKELPIKDDDNFITLEEKLSLLASEMCLSDVKNYINGEIEPSQQNHELATYVKLISKEAGKIDWNRSAKEVFNLWRAYFQWPGIFTEVEKNNEERMIIKLDEIKVASENIKLAPGEILIENKKLYIGTGNGVIDVLSLTPQSKKSMKANDFANGFAYLNHSKCI